MTLNNDSNLTQKHQEVVEAYNTNHSPLELNKLYCSVTGKTIGFVADNAYSALIESLTGSPEEIADELEIRLIASMRPSIEWNMMRVESIADMRKTSPNDVLAYILNRFFFPTKTNDFNLHCANLRQRIRCYIMITESMTAEQIKPLLHQALRLDARVALGDEPKCPSLDLSKPLQILPLLVKLIDSVIENQEKLRKQANAARSNALSGKAYYDSFMEHRDTSPEAIARKKKMQDNAYLANVLDSLMNSPKNDSPATKPAAVASTKMPKRFGSK